MTQLGQGMRGQSQSESNIYTVLVIIAFVVLAVGIGYVWYKHQGLFKTHPFQVQSSMTTPVQRFDGDTALRDPLVTGHPDGRASSCEFSRATRLA